MIDLEEEVHLGENLYLSPTIPFKVTAWWREQLGAIEGEEIENSDLFLVATMHSNDPKILDDENDQIVDKCRNLFFAFLRSGYTHVESSPKLVTGSSEENVATFRSISGIDHPRCIMGTVPSSIDIDRLKYAYRLYRGIISTVYERRTKGRMIAGMNCLLNAIRSDHIYEKIREFVRAVEAFIIPEPGKTRRRFVSRTETFVGVGRHDLMGTIYDVRSAIEHLHDPLEILPGKDRKEKFTLLLRLGLTAEFIARSCTNLIRTLRSFVCPKSFPKAKTSFPPSCDADQAVTGRCAA